MVGVFAFISYMSERIARQGWVANQQLIESLSQVKQLSGLLPICSSCKSVRDDQGYWSRIEANVAAHSEADFSHGLCPDCARQLYPEAFEEE